jgi:hypothetical protein
VATVIVSGSAVSFARSMVAVIPASVSLVGAVDTVAVSLDLADKQRWPWACGFQRVARVFAARAGSVQRHRPSIACFDLKKRLVWVTEFLKKFCPEYRSGWLRRLDPMALWVHKWLNRRQWGNLSNK